jgi:hypothetical protein
LQTFEGLDQFAVKFFSILASRRDRSQHVADIVTATAMRYDPGVSARVPSRNLLNGPRMSQRLQLVESQKPHAPLIE